MHSIKEIIQDIEHKISQLERIFSHENPRLAQQPKEGKWSPLQHLDHLTVAAIRTNKAMANTPKWLLRWRFGRPNRPVRSYEAVVGRYLEKLAAAPTAGDAFSSGPVPYGQRSALLGQFKTEHSKFVRMAAKWKEADLDLYLVPHPLLGKLPVREFFFFMAYHLEHHTKAIERDLA